MCIQVLFTKKTNHTHTSMEQRYPNQKSDDAKERQPIQTATELVYVSPGNCRGHRAISRNENCVANSLVKM